MRQRPFDAIRRAIESTEPMPTNAMVRLDVGRGDRTGVPEIVLGGIKSSEEIASSLATLADRNGRALATRIAPDQLLEVEGLLAGRYQVERHADARSLVVAAPGRALPAPVGAIGVITAGSSDRPVAQEAALVATEMGVAVQAVFDVGVAGLHRLVSPLEELIANDVDAIVVVAGMDGALPSVVAGLVDVPVIGLPTSVGYGFGGGGEAALMSMLQSCAPGLAVVNIDNGVGAGSIAALIARRAHSRQP